MKCLNAFTMGQSRRELVTRILPDVQIRRRTSRPVSSPPLSRPLPHVTVPLLINLGKAKSHIQAAVGLPPSTPNRPALSLLALSGFLRMTSAHTQDLRSLPTHTKYRLRVARLPGIYNTRHPR